MEIKKLALIILILLTGNLNCFTISENRLNELANWFATGMHEVEKDYQLLVDQRKKETLEYTQTEANIKLLVDMYQNEIQPSHFNNHIFIDKVFWAANPPPKADTLEDIRKNENALIAWVLKVYAKLFNDPKKITPSTLAPLIKNTLKKERENSQDYVFYHGHSLKLGLTFDLFKELENFLFYSPELFVSEKITDFNPKESVLRYLQAFNSKYKTADDVVKSWQHGVPGYNDQSLELSALLLSTNFTLFGNTTYLGENTFAYFINSTSMLGGQHDTKWIDEIFNTWKFDPKYKHELNLLYNNFMSANNGNLLQIFIPKYLVNRFTYPCRDWGHPYDWSTQPGLKKMISPAGNVDTSDLLNFYKKANFPQNSLMAIDRLQTRIVLTPEFFDFNNGIKIFKYTTSALDGEFGADYKKGLRLIVAKMILNYVIHNQNQIRYGNNTALKKILYSISEWSESINAIEKEHITSEKTALLAQEKKLKKQQEEIFKNLKKEEEEKYKNKIKELEKGAADIEKLKKEASEKEKIKLDYNNGQAYYNIHNFIQAIAILKPITEQNIDVNYKANASWLLANIYKNGSWEVNKDYALAKHYAQIAVDNGHWNQNILNEINNAEKAEKEKTEKEKFQNDFNEGWNYSLNNNYAKAIEKLKPVADADINIGWYKGYAAGALANIYKTGVNKDYGLAKHYAQIAINNGYWYTDILNEVNEAEKNDNATKQKVTQPSQPSCPAQPAARQANRFKNITNALAKQAKVLMQFAGANKKQKNKLKTQVQKIKIAVNKVNINIRNAQGQTPLMVNPSIAPILTVLNKQKAKNTANAKDKKGKTVLQYLIASPYNGQVYLYKILKNAGVQVKPNDIKVVQRKLKNKPKVRDQVLKVLRGK